MGTITITFLITTVALILIVLLGVISFNKDSNIVDKISSVLGILLFTVFIIFVLKESQKEIENKGIENYLNNKIVRTIKQINYTEDEIPLDTIYFYKRTNE